jgi:hypothetical protein
MQTPSRAPLRTLVAVVVLAVAVPVAPAAATVSPRAELTASVTTSLKALQRGGTAVSTFDVIGSKIGMVYQFSGAGRARARFFFDGTVTADYVVDRASTWYRISELPLTAAERAKVAAAHPNATRAHYPSPGSATTVSRWAADSFGDVTRMLERSRDVKRSTNSRGTVYAFTTNEGGTTVRTSVQTDRRGRITDVSVSSADGGLRSNYSYTPSRWKPPVVTGTITRAQLRATLGRDLTPPPPR